MSPLTIGPAPDPAIVERPDEEAASLFELYRQRIRDYCYGQLRDRQEAEDAVQATFLYALALLRRGTKPKRPLPWLYTIAHNVCRTRRRALKRRQQIESSVDLETLHDTVGRNDPPREDLAELASSLTTLPPAQREALLLREWQGLSYAEIAVQLGLTESAVEAVLFRARRSLARTLRPLSERVASVVNGFLLLPVLRRLAPSGGTAKGSAAMLLAGTAAATTLLPLADTPRTITTTNAPSHVVRPHVTPRPEDPAAPQPRPGSPAAPPQPAVETSASAPSAPAPAAAAAAGAGAANPQPPAPPPPAAVGPTTPATPTNPPVPTPVEAVVATGENAAEAAANTVTNAISSTVAATDPVTSDVGSAIQSTVSSAQSTLSSVAGSGPEVPLPRNAPLQDGS